MFSILLPLMPTWSITSLRRTAKNKMTSLTQSQSSFLQLSCQCLTNQCCGCVFFVVVGVYFFYCGCLFLLLWVFLKKKICIIPISRRTCGASLLHVPFNSILFQKVESVSTSAQNRIKVRRWHIGITSSFSLSSLCSILLFFIDHKITLPSESAYKAVLFTATLC